MFASFPRRLGLRTAAVLSSLLLLGAACAPVEEEAAEPTAAEEGSEAGADPCAVDSLPLLTPGTLTIGTDSPAFEPWFVDDDPTNGQGFESAVAYAVAAEMGFDTADVTWVTVPFNNSYKPGAKDFDFDINQVSISPARAKVVDFSQGYYSASQAVLAIKGTPAAEATSLADLAGLRLGAQTGTTSLTAIRDGIKPEADPLVFEDTSAAAQALKNGQVDGILADLPTAFYLRDVEVPKSTIVGQFQPATGKQEEFGLLFEKGNELRTCVDAALTRLKDNGTLEQIETEWLSDTVNVPELS